MNLRYRVPLRRRLADRLAVWVWRRHDRLIAKGRHDEAEAWRAGIIKGYFGIDTRPSSPKGRS